MTVSSQIEGVAPRAPAIQVSALIPDTRQQAARGARGSSASYARPTADTYAGLAEGIQKDGGLAFLQSRLEEKLGGIFEAAQGLDPNLAATGSGGFFDTSLDVSPEATADRIVGFALGMFSIYREQNPGMSDDEMTAGFESEIRRGIEDGFASARRILSGLEILDGTVSANVDKTWELVMDKLDQAFAPSQSSG